MELLLDSLTFISSLSIFAIAIIVLSKNAHATKNQAFAFLAFSFGIWAFSLYFYGNPIIFSPIDWLRIVYFIAHLIVLSFLIFGYAFPYPYKRYLKLTKIISSIHILYFPIHFYILWATDLFVKDVHKEGSEVIAEMGSFYPIYGLIATSLFIFSIYYLLGKYKESSGVQKSQIRIMAIASLATSIPILVVDVVWPIITGNTRFYSYSPIFVLILVGSISYTVIKHRLLGLRFIVGKILYYFLMAILSFILLLTIVYFSTVMYDGIFTRQSLVLSLLLTILCFPFFLEINDQIRNFVEKRIAYSKYDPYEIVNKLLKGTSTELGMEKISTVVLNIIKTTFEIERVGLIVFNNRKKKKVIFKKLLSFDEKSNILKKDLLNILKLWDIQDKKGEKAEVLVFHELLANFSFEKEEKDLYTKIVMFMKKRDLSIILPLNRKVQLNGVLIVGHKDEEEAFTVEDINLLENLIANTSVAIGRSILYEEVENFAETLKARVNKATRKLRKKVDALKEARRKERDMIDILGHELRTPISIIKSGVGFLEMLCQQGVDSKLDKKTRDTVHKYFNRIQGNVEREIQLIDTLLGATKLDKKRLDLRREEVNIYEVIRDSIIAHGVAAKKKKLDLLFEKPEGQDEKDFPKVYADRGRIQEVLDNLVDNAVKYTEKGEVVVRLEKSDHIVTITVRDTGVGIPKEDVPHLGEKFFRVNQYTKLREKGLRMVRPGGTGLGLYVAFGIIKAHGGRIWVKSKLGKGTEFHFTIPCFDGHKMKKKNRDKFEKDLFKRKGLVKSDST